MGTKCCEWNCRGMSVLTPVHAQKRLSNHLSNTVFEVQNMHIHLISNMLGKSLPITTWKRNCWQINIMPCIPSNARSTSFETCNVLIYGKSCKRTASRLQADCYAELCHCHPTCYVWHLLSSLKYIYLIYQSSVTPPTNVPLTRRCKSVFCVGSIGS